jgi:hypothetical protein
MRRAVVIATAVISACALVVPLDDLNGGDASSEAGDAVVEGAVDAGPDVAPPSSVQLLVLGGGSKAGFESSIIAAEIHSDGSLGTWRDVRPLPAAIMNLHGGFAIGDTIYVIANGNAISSRMHADGTLDPWTALTAMPDSRFINTATYANGYVFLAGGQDSNNAYPRSVYAAPVDGGTIGAWSATSSLAASDSGAGARAYHSAVAYGDWVYLVAGMIENSTWLDSIVGAQVTGSSLGPWTTMTPLPNAGYCPHVFAYDGRLFVLGGTFGNNASLTSYVSVIQDGGGLAPWTQSTAVQINIDNCGAFARYEQFVYVLGGESGGNYTDEVVFAIIDQNGDVGTWTHTTPLPNGGRADGMAMVLAIP